MYINHLVGQHEGLAAEHVCARSLSGGGPQAMGARNYIYIYIYIYIYK